MFRIIYYWVKVKNKKACPASSGEIKIQRSYSD